MLQEKIKQLSTDLLTAIGRKRNWPVHLIDLPNDVLEASRGSWPEDPIWDIPVRLLHLKRTLSLPFQAISKVAAEQNCRRCLRPWKDQVQFLD